MDITRLLSDTCLLAIYFASAGVLGELLHRGIHHRGWFWLARIFALLIVVPLALGLPFPLPICILVWCLGLATVLLFGLRPARLPAWISSPAFPSVYLSIVLLLIFLWSASTRLPDRLIAVGLPSIAAGAVLLLKSVISSSTTRRTA
jgi:hypothetical protein